MSLENCCVSHSLVDVRIPLVSHEEVERGANWALRFDLTLQYNYLIGRIKDSYPEIYSVLRAVGLNSLL